MKNNFLLIVLVAFCTTIYAQNQPTDSKQQKRPEFKFKIPTDSMELLTEQLTLTEEQVEKWTKINEKYQPKFEEIAAVDTLDDRSKMVSARKVIREKENELKTFIFVSQWETYQKIKRKNSGRRPSRMRGREAAEGQQQRRRQNQQGQNKGGN